MSIKIVIFEDHENLRKSLRILLEGVEGYELVGDFENCANAGEIARMLQPDIAIVDIDMPIVNGIDGIAMIKEAKPDTQVVMHTVFEDDDRLFQCLCQGATGYILKNSSFIGLLDAIENVHTGGSPMSPAISRKVLSSFHRKNRKNRYDLTPREVEVLSYMVKGFSYKMIASTCFISIDTVRGHIRNIYHKLHVNCGREAVVIALKERIV